MPVMKQLNVGGVTYDTVGEASVTQVVSTGTKIATVSIDGTSTDLYAPSGGSSVEPATDAPIVDGTAAVGTSAKYAREDHVHPTDTSRAAASHTHAIGDVTNLQSSLDAKQPTLVSGTNIKTINSTSLLGSGDVAVQPTLVSGTNIKTINGNSLLGSGDLTVGGSVTMEDSAVDAAVDAAFPVTGYTVTISASAGSVVSTNKQSANSGETVTLTLLTELSKGESVYIYQDVSGTPGTLVASPDFSEPGETYQFIMPAYSVLVTYESF